MNISDIPTKASKLIQDNSPTILAGVAVSGVVATAILSGQASYRAALLIHSSEAVGEILEDPRERLKEQVRMIWPLYIPALTVGGLTITAIVLSERIGTRRAAALAAAYSISEKAFEQYKEKVVEKLGKNADRKIRDEMAQDDVTKAGKAEVVVVGTGEVLCFDRWSGRYFNSSMESIKKAQNDLNYRVLNDNYASLNDFYNLVGLSTIPHGDDVGWVSMKLCEIRYSTVISEDEKPCIAIEFTVEPVRDYYKRNWS